MKGRIYKPSSALNPQDVHARPDTWTPSAADVGALPKDGTAVAASKLATPRQLRVDLASTTPQTFDGTANKDLSVTGTLAIANGGTGATTAADARSKLGVTPANIGAVPTTRKVNGHALDQDVTLAATDVKARPDTWKPTPADIGAQAALGFTPVQQGGGTGQGTNKVYIGWSSTGLKAQVNVTDLGAFVFASRTINGKALSANITLSAVDVKARPDTWTPSATDVGALPKDGTAAAANKLAASRTIFGQPFDGTGNVAGVCTVSACNATGESGFMIAPADKKTFIIRNDGSNTYFFIGNTPGSGAWNNARPLIINMATGKASLDGTASGNVPTGRTVNGKALTANISVDQLKNDAGVSLLAVAGSDTATRSYLRHTVIDSAGNFTQDWGYEKSTDRGYIYVPGKTLQYLYSSTHKPTPADIGAAAPNTDVHFNTIYAEAYNGLYIGPSSVRRVFFRNDGNTCYVMIAKSTTDLSWSSPFPLEINVSTGYTLVNGHANDDAYKAALVYSNAVPTSVQGSQTLPLSAHNNTAKVYAIVARSRTDNTTVGIVLATPGTWTTAVVRENATNTKNIYFRNVLVNTTLTGLQIEHGRISGDGGATTAESDVTCIITSVYAIY